MLNYKIYNKSILKKVFNFDKINLSLFFFFWPHLASCGMLVPQPGIEPGATAVKAPSTNHWTTREFPKFIIVFDFMMRTFGVLSQKLFSTPVL